MNAYLRCIVSLLFLSFLITTCFSTTKKRIVINEENIGSDEDPGCTRLPNGTLVCECDATFNNTYYPCFMQIEDADSPTPPPPSCVDCVPGSYSNISSNLTCGINCVPGGCAYGVQCPLCEGGSYAPHPRTTSCLPCLAGAASGPGATTCTPCIPGTHADHSGAKQCLPCAPGSMAPGPSTQVCTLCGAGSFNNASGSTSCVYCDPGSYSSSPGSTSCSPCPGGSYSSAPAATFCSECDSGYISSDGATSCELCPLGMYSNYSNCAPCDSGKYATGPTSVCQICDPGYFSPENETGITQCSICPVGTANNAPGNDRCPPCNAGAYSNTEGQHKCSPCPAGNYCPTTGTTTPVACPSGFYCKEGSTQPSQCATLYHSTANGAKCNPSPSFYLIIFGSILAAAVVALIGWRIRVSRHTEARRQNKQLEIDRLIPKPRDNTPTYSGL